MISRLPRRIVARANAPYEAQEGRWYSSVRLVCTFLQKNPSKSIKRSQCCGTVMIYSSFRFRGKRLVLVSAPVPDTDEHFSKNKKITQNLACQKFAYDFLLLQYI